MFIKQFTANFWQCFLLHYLLYATDKQGKDGKPLAVWHQENIKNMIKLFPYRRMLSNGK